MQEAGRNVKFFASIRIDIGPSCITGCGKPPRALKTQADRLRHQSKLIDMQARWGTRFRPARSFSVAW